MQNEKPHSLNDIYNAVDSIIKVFPLSNWNYEYCEIEYPSLKNKVYCYKYFLSNLISFI